MCVIDGDDRIAKYETSPINTMQDCIDYGGQWQVPTNNFDNIQNSMLTIAEMMTLEGWLNVM